MISRSDMKTIIIILFILLSFHLHSESPFHTEIVITSDYLSMTGKGGERRPEGHTGIDCHAVNFYPVIYPIMAGEVIEVDWDDIHGKFVVIQHPGGIYSKYSHGKMIFYSASGAVDTNTPIMIVGETGYTDGIHLHLEVYKIVDGVKIYFDPKEFI